MSLSKTGGCTWLWPEWLRVSHTLFRTARIMFSCPEQAVVAYRVEKGYYGDILQHRLRRRRSHPYLLHSVQSKFISVLFRNLILSSSLFVSAVASILSPLSFSSPMLYLPMYLFSVFPPCTGLALKSPNATVWVDFTRSRFEHLDLIIITDRGEGINMNDCEDFIGTTTGEALRFSWA